MRKGYRRALIALIIIGVAVGGWGGYTLLYNKRLENEILSTNVDTKVFRPYILGTPITFKEGGNSAEFVKTADGWGGQEPEHRCAVGDSTVMRLYIPEAEGVALRITMDGFGVYPPKISKYQYFNILYKI